MSVERIEIVVPNGVIRRRLEDFLFERFGGLSRMYLRDVIKTGGCEVNGRFENKGFRVRTGDLIEIELDLARETAMRPQAIDLEIVYEDDELLVVDKPAGMLVHPTHREKSGTLLNALAFHLGNGKRPGLVHRLDRETSGLILVTKTAAAHKSLAGQFRKKHVEKRYIALVEGRVTNDEGVIEMPIGRNPDLKHWEVKGDGKVSTTRYMVRGRLADLTLLELEPVTGRTNQLRIHCAAIGNPIRGDVRRGGKSSERLYLHASKLSFTKPRTGERLTFVSPSPFSISY